MVQGDILKGEKDFIRMNQLSTHHKILAELELVKHQFVLAPNKPQPSGSNPSFPSQHHGKKPHMISQLKASPLSLSLKSFSTKSNWTVSSYSFFFWLIINKRNIHQQHIQRKMYANVYQKLPKKPKKLLKCLQGAKSKKPFLPLAS